MNYKKPSKLTKGDIVAVLSPSWSGPNIFPHVYENGLTILKEWGLQVKEYPTTRATNDFLSNNPELRAKDINDAFADPEVKAIFASIGGEDSVRILPFLNKEIISANPKILMGYSDTTTLLVFGNLQGMVTFHGPSVMAGFSQMEALPQDFKAHVYEMLFEPKERYLYKSYNQYCDGYLDWSKEESVGKIKELKQSTGWNVIQGSGAVEGQLIGGCIEVLEFIKGTEFWPKQDFWKGKILFLETSEEKPPMQHVRWMLRNYGTQGIFNEISALLFARARDYSDNEKKQLDEMIKDVVSREFKKHDLPIMTNMDFGHTDPQIVLPLGVNAKVDFDNKTFELIESCIK